MKKSGYRPEVRDYVIGFLLLAVVGSNLYWQSIISGMQITDKNTGDAVFWNRTDLEHLRLCYENNSKPCPAQTHVSTSTPAN